ncbi:MAG: hypothetical protein ACRBHB_22125 [Arenicella sp.]
MTITIQKNVQSFASLSTQTQLVLGFIPEGKRWLEESSSEKSSAYYFDSEADLLSAILDGLHNTKLLYLPLIALLVDPEKILLLGSNKLSQLSNAINDDDSESALLITQGNGLLDNKELKQHTDSFFKKSGLSSNALFQMMTLNDFIVLYSLTNDGDPAYSATNAICAEAGAYAADIAQTPVECCHLYCFYLQIVNKLSLQKVNASDRKNQVEEIYQALVPLADGMLVCPQISGGTGEEEINQAIQTWLDYGNQIGFSSLATALLQLSKNIALDELDAATVTEQVEDYLTDIGVFLRDNSVGDPVLSQDGEKLTYSANNQGTQAQFSLNHAGCLVLDVFSYQKPSSNKTQN